MSAALLARLRAVLASQPEPARADGIAAAVLVPLIAAPQPRLLLTRRTDSLTRHAGQVSFPGGRSEAADASPLHTALREAQEETGLAPGLVSIAGYLPRIRTVTGFDVQPVVGVLAPDPVLAPDLREVAEVFEVPLVFFGDPANRRQEQRTRGGVVRSYHAFTHEGREIWGATAGIIVELVTRLECISGRYED